MKLSFTDFFSTYESVDLVKFTFVEEILNEKLDFLCSDIPLDTGHKLNKCIELKFKRVLERLLKVLCTLNLCPGSRDT